MRCSGPQRFRTLFSSPSAGVIPNQSEPDSTARWNRCGVTWACTSTIRPTVVVVVMLASSSAAAELGVQDGAQAVAQQVEAEDGQHDRHPREDAHPRGGL